jgi:hypothetical protein
LPEGVGELRCLVTNANREMEECAAVKVEAGIAEFALPAASFVTLLGTRS